MMEQSTHTTNINGRPKKKIGRPKGTARYTEEENKERARQRARLYYFFKLRKIQERQRLEQHAKKTLFNMFKQTTSFSFEFPFKQMTKLNICIYIYIYIYI